MLSYIYAPFAIVLRYLSEWLDNYGLALIVLGLVMALIRVPFDLKSKRGTLKMSLLQPKTKAIQEKYAGNQLKINQETHKLYRQEGVKPLGGCIWMIFPMVILLILFQIIRQPLTNMMGLDAHQIESLRLAMEQLGIPLGGGAFYQVEMAGFIRPYYEQLRIAVPEIFNINMNFLGLDIGQTPNWRVFISTSSTAQEVGLALLPVLSMGAAFFSQKVMMATNYMPQAPQQAQMMKTMMLTMPIMSLVIGFTFPAAMSLYWTVSSLGFVTTGVFTNRYFKKVLAGMKAEMDERDRIKQEEIDAKRKKTEELRAAGLTQENKGTSKKKKQVAEKEKERQRQAANKSSEREDEEDAVDPSREGHRKFARGRAYNPERFDHLADDADEEEDDLPSDNNEDEEDEYLADEVYDEDEDEDDEDR